MVIALFILLGEIMIRLFLYITHLCPFGTNLPNELFISDVGVLRFDFISSPGYIVEVGCQVLLGLFTWLATLEVLISNNLLIFTFVVVLSSEFRHRCS